MDLFDEIHPGILGLLIGFVVAIGRYFYMQKGDREADVIRNKTFQNEIKKRIKERKKIKLEDVQSISENKLWEIIEVIKKRSKESYKNFLGLLKDHLLKQDQDKILGVFGRCLQVIVRTNNYQLLGAFNVISSAVDFKDFDIFSNWLMSRGEVIFNNSINNPELISNIEIKDLVYETILGVIAECYEIRFQEIIPDIIDFEVQEPEGEELEAEQLPDKFPRLWEKFIRLE